MIMSRQLVFRYIMSVCMVVQPYIGHASPGVMTVSRYRRGTISGYQCNVNGQTYNAGQTIPDISPCKSQCRCFASLFGRTGQVVCAISNPCSYTNLCVNPIKDSCGCPKCRPGGWIWPPKTASALLSEKRAAWQISTQKYKGQFRGANLAVDGVTNGDFYGGNSCTHTAKHYQPWWIVDLGKTFVVTSVVIFNRAGKFGQRLVGAEVRVGDSSLSGGNPPCGGLVTSAEVAAGTKITRDCPTGRKGRFVSVRIKNRREFLSLCEVKVFGHEIAENGEVVPFPGYPPLPSNLIQTPGYPSGFLPGSEVTGGNCLVPDPQSKSNLVIPDGTETVVAGCAKCRCSPVASFASAVQVVDRGCECDYSGCCEYQGKYYAPNQIIPDYDGDDCGRVCRCLPGFNGEKPLIACEANSNVCDFESRCVHYEVNKCGCPYCPKGVSDCWGYDPWKQVDVCVPDGYGPVVINPQHPDYACQCMYVTTIQVNPHTAIPHEKLRRAICSGKVH